MKFCNNCGSQLEDQSTFCPNCGTACAAEQKAAPAGANVVDKVTGMGKDYVKKAKTNKLLIIIPAAAVLVVIALIVVLCLLPSYKDPIEDFVEISAGMGSDGQIEDRVPEAVWKQIEDKQEISLKDVQKGYQKWAEDALDENEDEYGKGFDIDFEWTDKDEITGKKLTAIKDSITGTYEDIKSKDITEAYKVDVTVTISGSEDEEDEDFEDFIVVKIDGDWYSYSAIMSAASDAERWANYGKE